MSINKKITDFKSYLENKGFYVNWSGRIDKCPICNKKGTASLKDGKIKCFRVGCELNSKGVLSLDRYIKEFDRGCKMTIHNVAPKNNKKAKGNIVSNSTINKNHEIYNAASEHFHNELLNSKEECRYLTETRGRTSDSLSFFKVGLVANTYNLFKTLRTQFSVSEIEASGLYRIKGNRIKCLFPSYVYTYPIWWNGKIRTIKYKGKNNGYIAKRFTGDDFSSFLNSDALNKDELILVEGENDAMRLWELGKKNTVAILGSLSNAQLKCFNQLSGKRTIYLCFDNDKAGEEYIRKTVSSLKWNKNLEVKVIPYKGADPDVGTDFKWDGVEVNHNVNELKETNPADRKSEITSFGNKYVKVEVGSKIIYANKQFRTQWLDSRNLLEKHGDSKNELKYWMNNDAEFAECGVCCDFSTTDYIVNNRFNMFEGFAISPKEGTLPVKWLGFVKEVICSGNEEYYDYLLDWLSDMCQNPNKQTSVVPVIISKQGAGKNLFVNPMQKIIGEKYSARVDDMDRIIGNYNGMVENKLLLNLDEATFGRSNREKNRFKSLTGNPSITINMKFKPAYEADFSCRFIVTSNELAPVAVEADNRRFFVLEASNHRIGQREYYRDIWDEIKDESKLSTLYHFLKTRTISAEYNRTYVKHTIFEKGMAEETQDSIGMWLDEVDAGLASSPQNWHNKVEEGRIRFNDLYNCYDVWFDHNRDCLKYNEKFTKNKFSKLLKQKYWKDVEFGQFRIGGVSTKGFRFEEKLIA